MSEEFELISVPKELLENLVRRILADYISLSTPKPEQDEEPIYMFRRLGQDKFVTCSKEQFDELSEKSIFETRILHPAPRKHFVRLSEEEVDEIVALAQSTYEAVCATENRLVRKNQ